MKIQNVKIIVGEGVEPNWFGYGLRFLKAARNLPGVEQAIINGCEQFFKDEFSKVNLIHITEMRITIKEFYQYSTNKPHNTVDFTFSLAVEYDTDLGFSFHCSDAVAWLDVKTHKIKEVTNQMLSRVMIDKEPEEVFNLLYKENNPDE